MAGTGGARPGAGRKKGTNAIEAEKLREFLIEKVREKANELAAAKMDLALGHRFQDSEGHVYTKSPDGAAIQYLLNQAIGKPKETVEHQGDVLLKLDV